MIEWGRDILQLIVCVNLGKCPQALEVSSLIYEMERCGEEIVGIDDF